MSRQSFSGAQHHVDVAHPERAQGVDGGGDDARGRADGTRLADAPSRRAG